MDYLSIKYLTTMKLSTNLHSQTSETTNHQLTIFLLVHTSTHYRTLKQAAGGNQNKTWTTKNPDTKFQTEKVTPSPYYENNIGLFFNSLLPSMKFVFKVSSVLLIFFFTLKDVNAKLVFSENVSYF